MKFSIAKRSIVLLVWASSFAVAAACSSKTDGDPSGLACPATSEKCIAKKDCMSGYCCLVVSRTASGEATCSSCAAACNFSDPSGVALCETVADCPTKAGMAATGCSAGNFGPQACQYP